MKQKLPRIDIGSIHLEPMNEGDTIELPRWVAEVLLDMGVSEIQEENFSSEVFKAVTREKIAGNDQLSTLRPDFYLKVRRQLSFVSESPYQKPSNLPELEKTRTLVYDLVALRLRKILSLAVSLSTPIDIRDKLTPEEYQIFRFDLPAAPVLAVDSYGGEVGTGIQRSQSQRYFRRLFEKLQGPIGGTKIPN